MYLYIKSLHIIFVVTWFAGLFYIVRLFIYQTEALQKAEPEKSILHNQLSKMARLLWYVIHGLQLSLLWFLQLACWFCNPLGCNNPLCILN